MYLTPDAAIGFVDPETGELPFQTVTVEFGGGTELSAYALPTQVLWHSDSAFSTADIEVYDARISEENIFGAAIPIGTEVTISVDGIPIFKGYIIRQKATATGGTSKTKKESIGYSCVDYKYDLYRETIVGQIGPQASEETGEESGAGGIYGAGLGWFTGLDCVFNDRTFAKLAESAWSRNTKKVSWPLGNSRKPISIKGFLSPSLFDGDYSIYNALDSIAKYPATRNLAWSGYDMINYILAYCYKPPISLIDPTTSVYASVDKIVLGAANGMDAIFPANVDVQGLRGTDAITKVCEACGYHWSLDMTTDKGVPCTLVLSQSGTPGSKSLEFFMGDGGSGIPSGLYTTLAAPLTYERITESLWNISEIEINTDYTALIGYAFGTTAPIKVQNAFPLRKGWTNKAADVIIKAVGAVVGATGTIDYEPQEHTFVDSADGSTKKWRLRVGSGDNVQIVIDGDQSDDANVEATQDSFKAIFRRWVLDEKGIIDDPTGGIRKPFPFNKMGLLPELGSTYMIKPRPFLNNNIDASKSGERSPPRTYFFKYSSGQISNEKKTPPDPKEKQSARATLQPLVGEKIIGGKSYYPFGAKHGHIRILKDIGGIYIEGGSLDLQVFTIDPITKKVFTFPPMVIGAVEHDQAKIVTKSYIDKIGTFIPGRRWVDGKKFRVDNVHLVDQKSFNSPEAVSKEAPAFVATKDGILLGFSTDETDRLDEDLDAKENFFKSPIVSMRSKVPVLTTAYVLGTKVPGIYGRFDVSKDKLPTTVVVGVQFDLLQRFTMISVDSESNNPVLSVGKEGYE